MLKRTMKDKVPYVVVLASNEKGVLPLSVMVWSLLHHAKPESSYRVCILSEGISDESKRNIEAVAGRVSHRHVIEFVEMDRLFESKPGLDEVCGNWPRSAWARIFIPDIMPEVSRALYLDIDMLVCDDCSSLFTMDMKGAALGAVYEHTASVMNKKLGIPAEYPGYFNSGTLLMDLDVFRREKLADKLLEFAAKYKDVLEYPDQDALNGVLYDSVVRLHPRWNWNDIATRRILNRNPKSPKLIRAATFREAVEASYFPGILHYCGQYKPWKYNYHITRHLYEKAIKESGVKGMCLREGWTWRMFFLRLAYAPLSMLTWWKIRRMIKKYGITSAPQF